VADLPPSDNLMIINTEWGTISVIIIACQLVEQPPPPSLPPSLHLLPQEPTTVNPPFIPAATFCNILQARSRSQASRCCPALSQTLQSTQTGASSTPWLQTENLYLMST
jgi:hypothetical protein